MTKVTTKARAEHAEPRTDLAAEVAPKLEAARACLAELEEHVGAAALAVAINELGAADRLTELNVQVEAARRDVVQLEAAHRHAEQRDAAARAALARSARKAQLIELQRCADRRLAAMEAVSAALETAAKAYNTFLDETTEMARAFPTGTVPFNIDWMKLDFMVDDRTFPAGLDVIIAGEMFRHADPARVGSPCGALAGARAPAEALRLRPAMIEPATAAVERTNKYLVGLVAERLDAARFVPPVAPVAAPKAAGPNASAIERTKPTPTPAPAQPPAAVTDINSTQEFVPEEFRPRLARLLKEMARLANDTSPQGSADYQRVGDEVEALQREIAAAKTGAVAA
jgi:hypothetical protein